MAKNIKFIVQIESRRQIRKEIVEAESKEQALRRAKTMGKVVAIDKQPWYKSFEIKMDDSERQIFLQRLAAMLASRVGAGQALRLMRDTFKGPISKVSGRMLNMVESGDNIGKAMEKIGNRHFGAQVIALVQAGERGGNTSKALKNAAQFEMEMDRIKKSAGSGIWSGLSSFFVAAILILGTRFFFAPKMLSSDIIQMKWEEVEATVNFWKMVADISAVFMGIFILFLMFVMFMSALSRVGPGNVPQKADRVIMGIPIVKDLILAKNNYTAIFGLSMLIESGVSMVQSLTISADATRKGQMKEDFKAAAAAVNRGKEWAQAMYGLHPTDKAALSTSEDRSQIAESLNAIAEQYKAIYASRIAMTAPVLQGIAALFLMIGAGVLFGMSILPMLKISASGL